MFKSNDIIMDDHPNLKKKSEPVKLPVSPEDKQILRNLLSYVLESQNPDKTDANMRPAVGLAAPQVNIPKQMFAIITHDLEGELHVLGVLNPKIIKRSKEMTYIPGGEGCLSVSKETEGMLTPRYRSILVEAYFLDFEKDRFIKKRVSFKDYIAIVFQHEYDHLQGTLFTDKMFKELANLEPLYPIEEPLS
ncbi:MAG: peptide deformylase [Erysipelotrichales bacterium]|nr:peptide deformylase [Erysipelotrichales bacterium]